ncbi:anaerobic C4-dicarboxylate transporter [Parendozoicomonas haliclonae]|uniref:C4-dicarboxylate transporter n=1 Tax=Parendozoicomonas haliclonae TaxID=1960125 RepID=A0A1X7AKU9_9GAMM|nr:anaerobic C4-dicarboxylate transporter [Parendozoicomonas haliclonae]SMA48247.1 Anaerobic C4-dicarboxylate transporter DcuA [Parendozoicomonas haliclonae]
MALVHLAIVLASIWLAAKVGSIAVGLAGGLGMIFMTLVLGVQPGSPPIDVMMIIMAVIAAASTMQAAGGTDYLIDISAKILKRNPRRITYVAPVIAWFMTFISGTGYTVFSILPVVSEVAKRSGVRPSRPLSMAVVASQLAISASPISAAMAALLASIEPLGVSFLQIMAICVPASFIGTMIAAFVADRMGVELDVDAMYQERLKKGQVTKRDLESFEIRKGAKSSVLLFLAATAMIVVYAALPELRPAYADGTSMSTTHIIVVLMLGFSCISLLLNKIDPAEIVNSSTFRSGMSGIICILGIVWLGTTLVSNYLPEIKETAAGIVEAHPWTLAFMLFAVCMMMFSQGATSALMVPTAVAIGIDPFVVLASFAAVTGLYVLPTYPTSLAAMEIDDTGTTRIGKHMFDHPFFLPGITGVVVGVGVGFLMVPMVS